MYYGPYLAVSFLKTKEKVTYLKRNTLNLRRHNSNSNLTLKKREKNLNITFVGAPGVGKSAIVVRLLTGKFIG